MHTWVKCAAAAAVLLCAAPHAARAAPLWSDEDGARQLEARAFYKTFATGLLMPKGLVDGTAALERAYAEAGIAQPMTLPRVGGMSAHSGRVEAKLTWSEWLQVEAAWQVEAVVANDPAFTAGASLTGTLAQSTEGPTRRLVDFDPVIYARPGLRLQHNFDRLAARLSTSFGDLVVGRQVLSWGTGRLWNPTDLLSPFSPNEIDREVRRGIDAVRLSVPLARAAQLELIWLPRLVAQENGGAVRAQANAFSFDFSASVAKYVDDVVLGADFSGDLGPVGVHAEAAYTFGLSGVAEPGPIEIAEQALRAVAGVDFRVGDKAAFTAEYHFNGWGAQGPAGYLQALINTRVRRGEVFGAGRHYVGVVGSYQVTELLTAQLIALANVSDPSLQLTPVVEYWFEQSVIVRAGAFIPLGAEPDARPLQALTGADVLTRSERYRDAVSTFGLRSEYGTSAAGLFAQVGIYFQ